MPCLLNIIHLLFQNGEFSHPKWSQNIAKIRVDRKPFSTWSKSIHLENSGKKWFLSNVSSTFFSKINVIQLGIERYPINTNFAWLKYLTNLHNVQYPIIDVGSVWARKKSNWTGSSSPIIGEEPGPYATQNVFCKYMSIISRCANLEWDAPQP